MGINIIIYKEVGRDEEGYIEGSNDIGFQWDSLRHSGDMDFISQDFYNTIQQKEGRYSEHDYKRISNFEAARKWVSEQDLPDANKRRLNEVIYHFETDKSLMFKVSW